MANPDKIEEASVFKDKSNKVVKYNFIYNVGKKNDDTKRDTVGITVQAEDMQDEDDVSEAKAIAKPLAKAARDRFDEKEEITLEDLPNETGDVDLDS